MRHNLWDRMMYRLLQEKKEKEVKASKSKGAKPDFLDLDKDGNTSEPMKKAAKEAEGDEQDDEAESEESDEQEEESESEDEDTEESDEDSEENEEDSEEEQD